MRDNIEFEESVKLKIELFDDLLSDLGKQTLLENPDFTLDTESSNAYAAIFAVNSQTNSNAANMWLHVMGDGLRLDIDGIPELFEWSDEQVRDSRKEVVTFLAHLLTGYIMIETHGSRRFVEIYDSRGNFVDWVSRNKTIHMITGLRVSRFQTHRRLFLPFYQRG